MSFHNHDDEIIEHLKRGSKIAEKLRAKSKNERSEIQNSVTFKSFCNDLNECFSTPCSSLNMLNDFYSDYKNSYYNGTPKEWAMFFFCEHEPPFDLKPELLK